MAVWPEARAFGQVLRVGLPLMAGMAATTVMQFVDRAFLGGYSLEALAAAGAAWQVAFLCLAFFMGVAGYLNVFVAQFAGSGQHRRVGAVVWLGLRFVCAAELVLAGLSLLARPIFELAGHAPPVAALETSYFRLLTLGGGLFVAGPALGAFFSGRGRTRPVMLANLLGVVCFVPLDYALIHGWGPFPELGLQGSALATICEWAIVVGFLAALIFIGRHDRDYGLKQGRAWDGELFALLWRQGLGGGLQSVVEVLAVTWFVFMLGRLGTTELAVSSMVLAIDAVAFTPMLGLMVAVSTLSGQAVGRGEPSRAREPAAAALLVILGYVSLIAAVFFLAPGWLLGMFRPRHVSPQDFAVVAALGAGLLRVAGVYRVFSAFGMVAGGVLRGAGDIRFITLTMAVAALAVLGLPLWLALDRLGLWGSWFLFGLYIAGLAVVFQWRFRRTKSWWGRAPVPP